MQKMSFAEVIEWATSWEVELVPRICPCLTRSCLFDSAPCGGSAFFHLSTHSTLYNLSSSSSLRPLMRFSLQKQC